MRSPKALPLITVAVGTFLLAGCEPGSTAPEAVQSTSADVPGVAAAASPNATIPRQMAELRRLLAPFHRIEAAMAAGWTEPITPCLEIAIGGMGFHYGNPAFLADNAANLLEPELLLYEPQAGGHLRLVAVEYIVPLSEPQPQPILGADFHAEPSLGIWALHVWLWRDNPDGTFADWNPKVSCEHA